MKEFWNNRYQQDEFAYGTEPNIFFKEQLEKLKQGSVLLAAEGEGRNAVFAASLSWQVTAFDSSIEAKKKAEQLAKNQNVSIDYQVADLETVNYKKEQFDVLGLIYVHFKADKRAEYHQKLASFVKPNGMVILEAFSKAHIHYNSENPKAGGPKDVSMLFSIDEIKADFKGFEILELAEKVIELNEGLYHIGKASVIRFVGKKI